MASYVHSVPPILFAERPVCVRRDDRSGSSTVKSLTIPMGGSRPQPVIPPRPAKQPLTGNGGPRLVIESSTLVRRSIVWADIRQRGDPVIDRRSFVRLA